jgi:uncharacterized protein YlzI (FlbEa/FlbD family)
MADTQINTVITFADDKRMDVQSTVEQITTAIETQKRMSLPVIKIIDPRGDEVWINANHIRTFKAYDPSQRQPSVAFR